jgi:hypothetical protein
MASPLHNPHTGKVSANVRCQTFDFVVQPFNYSDLHGVLGDLILHCLPNHFQIMGAFRHGFFFPCLDCCSHLPGHGWVCLRHISGGRNIKLLQGVSGCTTLPRHEQLRLSSPASSIPETHLDLYLQSWQSPVVSSVSSPISFGFVVEHPKLRNLLGVLGALILRYFRKYYFQMRTRLGMSSSFHIWTAIVTQCTGFLFAVRGDFMER